MVFNHKNTEGIKHSSIQALVTGPDGSVWIGTQGGGVNLFKDGEFTVWTTAQGEA